MKGNGNVGEMCCIRNMQHLPEAPPLEGIKLCLQILDKTPGLCSIQEDEQYICPKQVDFCVQPDVTVPYYLLKAAHSILGNVRWQWTSPKVLYTCPVHCRICYLLPSLYWYQNELLSERHKCAVTICPRSRHGLHSAGSYLQSFDNRPNTLLISPLYHMT